MSKLNFENIYVPVDDEMFERLLAKREEIFARCLLRLLQKEDGKEAVLNG
jgi:hypothetical protein